MELIQASTLYYRAGTSDKVYALWLLKGSPNFYSVQYAYGRRGGALKYSMKVEGVSSWRAQAIFEKVESDKRSEGYVPGPTLSPPGWATASPAPSPAPVRLLPIRPLPTLRPAASKPVKPLSPTVAQFAQKPKRAIELED